MSRQLVAYAGSAPYLTLDDAASPIIFNLMLSLAKQQFHWRHVSRCSISICVHDVLLSLCLELILLHFELSVQEFCLWGGCLQVNILALFKSFPGMDVELLKLLGLARCPVLIVTLQYWAQETYQSADSKLTYGMRKSQPIWSIKCQICCSPLHQQAQELWQDWWGEHLIKLLIGVAVRQRILPHWACLGVIICWINIQIKQILCCIFSNT